jgi:hypothetical protein
VSGGPAEEQVGCTSREVLDGLGLNEMERPATRPSHLKPLDSERTLRDVRSLHNNEMQLTGGEGSSRQWGSPSGEPVPRSRRQASPPAADLGVSPTWGDGSVR